MANLIMKFAVANHDDVQSLVEQGLLKPYTYVYCREGSIVFIDKDSTIHDVEGYNQTSIILVDELPKKNIKSNTFYICNGIGYLLINDVLVPIFRDVSENTGVSSYDELSEIPIINKKGTIVSPVILSDLSTGCYSVSGQYQIGGTLTTTYVPSSNVIILIETDETNKYITRIDGKRVVVYTINLETMKINSDEYATQTWVKAQGYTTESYVNQAIEDLYNKILNEALVTITKVSQLENDLGYLTAEDLGEIGEEDIANLFLV